ncbi:MAG TPA: hypothetical protein VGR45_16995 [Stellaceae bacterium]|nr:hypothetical protein [Stellaceae bacterium]
MRSTTTNDGDIVIAFDVERDIPAEPATVLSVAPEPSRNRF